MTEFLHEIASIEFVIDGPEEDMHWLKNATLDAVDVKLFF